MKQTIRNKIFETNSSSAHTLVYSKERPERFDFNLDTDENGIVTIHFREYGWSGPEETGDLLTSANDKLDYVMTFICAYRGWDLKNEEVEEFLENNSSLKEYLLEDPEVRDLLDGIEDCCPNVTGFKFELNDDPYYDAFGSIDHQSQDLFDGNSIGDLINIIFNKGCMIVIDNDNSYYYTSFNPLMEPGKNRCISPFTDYDRYNITEKDFEE